jgi:dTDP-glucose 4,6-dehydratase
MIDPTMRKMVRDDCRRVLDKQLTGLDALREGVLLVTGGTGFMGTWLAEMVAYLNDHHHFAVRLMLMSSRASSLAERVPYLAQRSDVELIDQDVVNLVELPEDATWVIHAAGDPDSRSHATDPLRTFRTIVRGTDAVLQAASRLASLRKVLHVSSGLVYGAQPRDLPCLSEDYVGSVDCATPGQAYAEAKRAAETLCASYRTQMRLPIVTARPFAFLGPYQRLNRPWAANNFIRDALRGGPIRIQGDGQSIRSYMHPADMAVWLLTILARGPSGSTYNVGSSEGVTLLNLARQIVDFCPEPVKVITRTLGSNAPRATNLVPDVTRARETLGLEIKINLDATLRSVMPWYRALETQEVLA